jgi:hypothetical protein
MKRLVVGLLVVGIALALAGPAWASETFGVESFASSIVSNEAGMPATQAGSHPYAITTSIVFNHAVTAVEEPPRVRTYGDPKDIEVNLPAGVIVDPRATEARCTEAELESPEGPASCPNGAAVGVFSIYVDGNEFIDEPVYNMAPPAGVPAELGFNAAGIGLIMHVGGKVRTGTDYGMSADISEISQEHPIYGLELTLWGDPSEASHDDERGLCADGEAKQIFKETGIRDSCPVEGTSAPFLTLPSSCTGEPLTASMNVDSWQEPGALNQDGTPDLSDPRWQTATSSSPQLTGCTSLNFSPKLTVSAAEPAAAHAESPSGLSVDLKLPDEESVNVAAGADLKEAEVTLPAGFAISPSAAGGREACTPTEIELGSAKALTCPEASKVGSAKILTPLLEAPLEGSIYLARPYENEPAFGSPGHPGGSLLALYVVAEGDGVLIKLPGKVEADSQTGQLTVTFANLPQLPIDEMQLSLYGGERGLLATPATCGSYAVQSKLTPWSGSPAVTESSTLEIDSGPHGRACPGGGFTPSFTAGTENNQAGAFSSFSLTFSRQDGEQRFGAYTVQMPPGLLAVLKNVALCPEPQASLGQCPQASAIGTTTVGVGPGEDPFYLPESGQPANEVYLTGPVSTLPGGSTLLEGSDRSSAPFGLSIVVPAIAGPFDLGNIVMRARIEVDPHTAQLTISSASLPTIWEGIPLDIRTVNMSIDRPGFTFNPTDCAPLKVTGTISSTGGMGGVGATNAAVSSPFQAADCAQLPFTPKLTALTEAKTSKQDGAYLHVKVVSGPTHPGQANIAKLKLDLPKQLPARQATLRQACASAVFEADSAACPAASVVGWASVVTPVFGNPLTGPAYLVSHGGAAFPDLEIVLEGEGVELELDGQTSIKHGVTSSTFKALPDAPISTFDLVLQNGPHSLLATNLPAKTKGDLCTQALSMPTAITGQNGAVIKQSTKIAVFACPRPRRAPLERTPAKRARG